MLNYFILNIFILYNIKMSESVRMNRSTFDAIKEHQQIQKYDALNTYNIFINDKDATGYIDGTSIHDSFKIRIPDNQSSHIKNAMVRVVGIGIGSLGGDVDIISSFKLETNFLKNCINAGDGKGRFGGNLGFFKVDVDLEPDDVVNDVPEIASALGTNGVASANSVFSNVAQNAHTITTTTFDQKINPLVKPISNCYIPCDNPFGKELVFNFKELGGARYDLGNGAGENTLIHLEVKLLPDNQANDRFTY